MKRWRKITLKKKIKNKIIIIAINNIRKSAKHKSAKVTTYKRNTSRNDLMISNFTNSKTKVHYQKIEIAN